MEQVRVRVMHEQQVDQPVAEKLCEDFAEWLEAQGFEIRPRGGVHDDRSYAELATEFIQGYK